MHTSKALLLTQSNICYMATTAAATESGTPAVAKAETVAESMDQRRTFASVDEAATYLNTCAERFTDFDTVAPLVARGMDEEGNFDPAIYTEGMRVLVAVLKNRVKDDKGNALPSTVKAIVVCPIPSRELILANEAATAWLDSVLDKELNHIAVRALRNADDVTTVADQIPQTLESYISSSRETGGIMETFDNLFKSIIAALAAKSPAWAKARLIKTELKKAMESAAYASEYYPALEDRGDKPSLFVMALQFGQRIAKEKGLDPAIFDKWLATRDAKTLKQTAEDSEDFDLDDLELKEEEVATPATDTADDVGIEPAPDATEEEVTEENTTPDTTTTE